MMMNWYSVHPKWCWKLMRGGFFYKVMGYKLEREHRHSFYSQYKNQPDDSNNQVIYKLQQVFPKQQPRRLVRLAIAKTYNNNKNHLKSIIAIFFL